MLPQEIIELIIDQLRTSPSALKSCSLVSRGWAARSQKHLFARVIIRSDCLRRWCRKIPPGPTGMSSLTGHLVLVASADPFKREAWFEPNLLIHASDHLSSFTNVHTLDVIRWKFSNEDVYTAPFSRIALTIHSLRITAPALDSSAFLTFATFFGRAESVYIIRPHITVQESATPDLVPTASTVISWTSLHLLDFADTGLPLLNAIAQLPLRVTNLTVGLRSPSYHSSSLTVLLRACSKTLQTLRLCRSAGGEHFNLQDIWTNRLTDDEDSLSAAFASLPLVLPPLPQLRSIQFCALLGVGWLRADTLLSITSEYISRITIEMQHLLDPAILGSVIDWDAIDRALRILETQSQSHRTTKMVVQFHCLTCEWKEEVGRLKANTGWLPRFEQVGVIEFVSDEDLYTGGRKYHL